jgi:hypothetical protein
MVFQSRFEHLRVDTQANASHRLLSIGEHCRAFRQLSQRRPWSSSKTNSCLIHVSQILPTNLGRTATMPIWSGGLEVRGLSSSSGFSRVGRPVSTMPEPSGLVRSAGAQGFGLLRVQTNRQQHVCGDMGDSENVDICSGTRACRFVSAQSSCSPAASGRPLVQIRSSTESRVRHTCRYINSPEMR